MKNVVLTGYRCTGKTSVGRGLAARLRRPFFDTDDLVRERTGMSVRRIVAEQGWASFRAVEKAAIADLASVQGAVVALGGGAVLDPENVAAVKANGRVVWLVADAQTIVARMVDPIEPAVVTVGQITGGAADNVIPASAVMHGTIRFTRPEVGERLRGGLRRIAEQTAAAHGARAEVEIAGGYPPMVNDPGLSRLIEQTGRELLGEGHVRTDPPISMGVEDFAYYAQQVPAAMFRLGVRPPDRDSYPGLHNPGFNFNDEALPVGIRMLCTLTKRFLVSRSGHS